MQSLGRRAFLAIVGMLSPLSALSGAAQRPGAVADVSAPLGVDEFFALSMRLTGRTGLDREIARIYLNALLTVRENEALLAQLAAAPMARSTRTPAQITLEAAIITAWYTGTYDVNGERRLATHTAALMWGVAGVSAPGVCAGATWARAPRPVVR